MTVLVKFLEQYEPITQFDIIQKFIRPRNHRNFMIKCKYIRRPDFSVHIKLKIV